MSPSIRDVPRSELRRIDEAAEDDAELAERLAAAVYGWRHANDEADWYDCRDESTGTKAEVKSAHLEVGDEYPAAGRFRLWRGQLRSLVASRFAGETGTSWVVFVLFDEDQPVDLRRMHARTARDLVEDTVGWGPSDHESFEEHPARGEQAKLPIDEVFPDR